MIRARGRQMQHTPGKMNRTEALYDQKLRMDLYSGKILWYKFEAIKFRLAKKTFYTPDFVVMEPDGGIVVHEVKGYMMDDAAVKLKVVSEMFPFRFLLIFKVGKSGWDISEV